MLVSQPEPTPPGRRRRALAAASFLSLDACDDSGEDTVVALLVPLGLDPRQQPIDTALT
jgi:hypothetical protein